MKVIVIIIKIKDIRLVELINEIRFIIFDVALPSLFLITVGVKPNPLNPEKSL
jgi:hypothetical protein